MLVRPAVRPGCRPVGRGIDNPTPPEDTSGGPLRVGPEIVSILRSGAAPPSELSSTGAIQQSCRCLLIGVRRRPNRPPRRRWHRTGVVPSL
jgi:hypothetical protein